MAEDPGGEQLGDLAAAVGGGRVGLGMRHRRRASGGGEAPRPRGTYAVVTRVARDEFWSAAGDDPQARPYDHAPEKRGGDARPVNGPAEAAISGGGTDTPVFPGSRVRVTVISGPSEAGIWETDLSRLRAIVLGLLVATVVGPAHPAPAADAPAWVNVTNNVGGATWGAYGVTYVKAVPDSDRVIAGVSERGLWVTADRGATWTALGNGEIKHRPGRIVFDPTDADTFWVSGCYGDGPHRTTDGGKTFTRLGRLAHSDGVAVDFTDPGRRTLLLGLHEQSQSLHRSTDGGGTWTRIGATLPPDSNHSTDPIALDAKTFLINAAGWKPKATPGIYRTEDAGATWTKVSDAGPAGEPLVAAGGAIYWGKLWGGGLLKSTDQGRTWALVSKDAKGHPTQLPGGRLAALSDAQIVVSYDGGATWAKQGPPAPFKPDGITYSDKGKAFYAWKLSDNRKFDKRSIVRLAVE